MIPDNYISLLEKLGCFAASEPSQLGCGEGWSPGKEGFIDASPLATGEARQPSTQERGGELSGGGSAGPYKAREAEDIFNNFFSIIHLISLISSPRDNVLYVTGKS